MGLSGSSHGRLRLQVRGTATGSLSEQPGQRLAAGRHWHRDPAAAAARTQHRARVAGRAQAPAAQACVAGLPVQYGHTGSLSHADRRSRQRVTWTMINGPAPGPSRVTGTAIRHPVRAGTGTVTVTPAAPAPSGRPRPALELTVRALRVALRLQRRPGRRRRPPRRGCAAAAIQRLPPADGGRSRDRASADSAE